MRGATSVAPSPACVNKLRASFEGEKIDMAPSLRQGAFSFGAMSIKRRLAPVDYFHYGGGIVATESQAPPDRWWGRSVTTRPGRLAQCWAARIQCHGA